MRGISRNWLPPSSLRVLAGLGVFLGFGLAMLVILLVTESVLTVWKLLQDLPTWFLLGYLGGVSALSGLAAFVLWRILRPKRKRPISSSATPKLHPEELQTRIAEASTQGIAVDEAQRELEELERRRSRGDIYVALFGSISVGKSSLIRALLPEAEVEIDPRGGTTHQVAHYHWTNPAGEPLTLTDLPGLFEPDGTYTTLAKEETQRAHIVIYVCDSDLTRNQYDEIRSLLNLDKPLLLAMNKADLYTQEELTQITERLRERLEGTREVEVIPIQAGGNEEITRIYPDGREEIATRERAPAVEQLMTALLEQIQRLRGSLDASRDRSLLALSGRKLESAVQKHRQRESQALVKKYTRRAIVGALAAVTPGTDVLIQGYLGIQMVKDLCKLYDVPTRDIDIRKFIDLVSQHVGKTLPMLLAISGNVLKAFPGMGTVTGALLHTVAYSLIFESLGKCVALTLDEYGELQPRRAISLFEETLGENLDIRARETAKAVLEELRNRGSQ